MAEQQQNPRENINTFTGGLVTDIDNINFKPETFQDARNIELLDNEGQGFVCVGQDGNKELFPLTIGFRPNGSFFINGILYITSFNAATNQGELGCFPSPKTWSKDNVEFERTYKPLNNFCGPIKNESQRRAFRTVDFNFQQGKFIDIRGKKVFDDSINLYMADGVNPLRVINTGFDQDGRQTNKLYYTGDFRHIVNVIRGADKQVNIEFKRLVEGGRWKSGNTFLYVRYSTEDFNKTNFLGESLPITVSNYPAKAGVTGSPGTHAIDDLSSKAIEIELSDIDTNYKFLEIAVIRYFSEDNGILLSEAKLINHRYSITGEKMTLRLNGYEQLIDIGFEEIIKPNNQEDVCDTIEILENRLWGANWKRNKVHDPVLATNALKFRPVPKVESHEVPYSSPFFYSNPDNLNKVGYFRGESYAFQVIYVYDDGSESLGYPTSGIDLFDVAGPWSKSSYDVVGALTNYNGIVRFPRFAHSPAFHILTDSVTGAKTIRLNVMKVEFQKFGELNLPANVKGFYFTRAERIPNLVTQGISMNGCCSTLLKSDFDIQQDLIYHPLQDNIVLDGFFKYFTSSESKFATMAFNDYTAISSVKSWELDGYWSMHLEGLRNGVRYANDFSLTDASVRKVMPIYKGYYPAICYNNGAQWKYMMQRSFYVKNHYGIFSPDFILDKTKKINTGVIHDLGEISFYDPYLNKQTDYKYWFEGLIDSFQYWVLEDGSPDLSKYKIEEQKRITRYAIRNQTPAAELLEIKSIAYNTGSLVNTIYEPSKFENVEKYLFPEQSEKFVSWYQDAGLNGAERGNQTDRCMISVVDSETKDNGGLIMCNRSMVTPRYVGIVIDGANTMLNLHLVNVYNYNPNPVNYDITKIYNLKTTSFFRISKTLLLANPSAAYECFSGDCFLQPSFMKIMGHSGSTLSSRKNEIPGNDGSFPERPITASERGSYASKIGHGSVMMFITENSVNAELRVPVKGRSFYPFNKNILDHAVLNSESKETAETDILNTGYNRTLPARSLAMYNPDLPEVHNSFPNRVRYSNKDIPGSYIDAFSTFEFLSYKDFNVSSGAIKRLFDISGWLIGVCENEILNFYVNSNQIKADPNADNMLLGVSDILHENARTILNLGTQFFSGSVNTGKNIVGLDWKNKAVWCVMLQVTEKGAFPSGVDLSKELMCSKMVRDIITQESGAFIDKTTQLVDNLMDGKGIYCTHHNGRVYIAIHGQEKQSIVFDERLRFFKGKSDFVPYFGAILGENLITWNDDHRAWITSSDSPKNTFFGQFYESYIKSIVNPFGIFEKVYDALVVHTPDIGLKRIEYQTEDQSTVHVFPGQSTPKRPWQDPVYKEDKLYVPTFPESLDFYGKQRHVQLRGTWLSVKLVFQRNTPFFIKNLLTKFRISKS